MVAVNFYRAINKKIKLMLQTFTAILTEEEKVHPIVNE